MTNYSCSRSTNRRRLFILAVFVLYPYLTIHMRELGISVEETAIMSALTPCVAILMPPVAGIVADRIGNFKVNLIALSQSCSNFTPKIANFPRDSPKPQRHLSKFSYCILGGSIKGTFLSGRLPPRLIIHILN